MAKTSFGSNELFAPFTFWFSDRESQTMYENYEDSILSIGSFSTVEEFWSYYSHMKRPENLPVNTEIHMFRKGIKPMWEDKANNRGGAWVLRIRKGLATRFWENLILAVLGNEYDLADEICGVIVSVRHQGDSLAVWHRNSSDEEAKQRIKDMIKTVLSLPASTIIDYKLHSYAIRKKVDHGNSSQRS